MSNETDLIKSEVKKIIDSSKALIDQINEINEWNSATKVIMNISKIVTFIESVVITVENVYKTIFSDSDIDGSDKLEVAVDIIDDMFEFPFWFELIDEFVLRIIISVVVHYINKEFGHDWKLDVK